MDNVKSGALAVITNLGCLAAAWSIPVVATRLGLRDWLFRDVLMLVVAFAMSYVAMKLQARIALFILSVIGAAIAVETVITVFYGDRFRGFPSHMGVLAAVIFGLILGRTLFTAKHPATEAAA